jgi:anti-sigma regulatory factor (Ser/Thr protein kinase)
MQSIFHKDYEVVRDDFANAGTASSDIKRTLSTLGFQSAVLRRIAIASYEAEINLLIHAWGGNINLDVFDNGTVQLIFKDPGPGIPDLEKAMTPGWSTANQKAREMGFGAGMGLPNMKNVSDTFDIQSSSAGTTITMTFTEAPQ